MPNLKQKIRMESQPDAINDWKKVERGLLLVNELTESKDPLLFPTTGSVSNQGEMLKQLLEVEFETLRTLMHSSYIHCLHRITLTGVHPPNKLGIFRKTSVHVGDYDTYFPLPSAVPKLMEEFCKEFPNVSSLAKYDRILMAAKISHRFVRIHPYTDGNGRVSRLLMNLILMEEYPPAYLKADKKGRSRYIQALRRANRGDIQPLGCLITMSLIAIYTRALKAVLRN